MFGSGASWKLHFKVKILLKSLKDDFYYEFSWRKHQKEGILAFFEVLRVGLDENALRKLANGAVKKLKLFDDCLLYTSPSPRD